jgi:hypothetical protein
LDDFLLRSGPLFTARAWKEFLCCTSLPADLDCALISLRLESAVRLLCHDGRIGRNTLNLASTAGGVGASF